MIVLPLLAAAGMIPLVGPRYAGTIIFSVTEVSRDGDNAGSLDFYTKELMLTVWQWRHDRQRAGSASSFDWSVEANPTSGYLRLLLSTGKAAATQRLLGELDDRFQSRLDQVAEADERYFVEELDRLGAGMARLDDRASSVTHALPSGDPVEQIVRANSAVEKHRRAYRSVRSQLDDTLAERDALLRAPEPTAAVVDETVRQRAYAANRGLQEDLRHLEVRLAQARKALLKAEQKAGAALDSLVEASESMARLGESQEARAATGRPRASLERVVEHATQYETAVKAFGARWADKTKDIRTIELDPDAPELPRLSDDLAELAARFLDSASATIEHMRSAVRSMSEQGETAARHHVLIAAVTRTFHKVQTAHRQFAWRAIDIDSRDNYILDSALQSALGLAYRTRLVRKAIDTRLEKAALLQAVKQREERIAALEMRIEQQRSEATAEVDKAFAAQQGTGQAMNELPKFVRQTVELKTAQGKRNLLADQRGRISGLLGARGGKNAVRSVDSSAVQTVARRIDRVPANLIELSTTAGLAWAMTFLAVLATWRFLNRAATVRERGLGGPSL